ncbi:PilZ domain-containing protein [Pseudoduganella danionis]|uniref:PilZ domain-containing protein n=1 Tax=Pseudoduganella danionis TaxID=1890295 RepID=A0ABW9SP39_9BURK|nr:PilZ domain-containing protein [Pseudoduganella danionis]MTW32442.1 PilZ domain-containing protein [Pseudoduganella danionis]
MDSRREHARRLLTVPSTVISLDGSPPTNAHLIDLSRNGVGFLSNGQLRPSAFYELQFRFPGQNVVDSVRIEVVYSALHEATGLFRCGARIHSMEPESFARLIDYVTMPVPE